MGLGRGVAAFILLMTGLGLSFGGFSVLAVHSNLGDSEGFIMSRPTDLTVDSYAIIHKAVNIDPAQISRWIPNLGDFVQPKIVATSNDPSEEVFIGITGVTDASGYLNGTNYHEVDDFFLGLQPLEGHPAQDSLP